MREKVVLNWLLERITKALIDALFLVVIIYWIVYAILIREGLI